MFLSKQVVQTEIKGFYVSIITRQHGGFELGVKTPRGNGNENGWNISYHQSASEALMWASVVTQTIKLYEGRDEQRIFDEEEARLEFTSVARLDPVAVTPMPSKPEPQPVQTFEDFMDEVDEHVYSLAGCSVHDLADYMFRSAYDDGDEPEDVASFVLADNGF